MSEDPIGLDGGLNTYAYAGNEPVNSIDSNGLTACAEAGGSHFDNVIVWVDGVPDYQGVQPHFCNGGGGTGGSDGGSNMPTIGPSTQPMPQEPHTSGPGPMSKVKDAAAAAWRAFQSECGQSVAAGLLTLGGDALFLMSGVEVGVAAKEAFTLSREAAAVGTASYHARVLARQFAAGAIAAGQKAELLGTMTMLEWAKGVTSASPTWSPLGAAAAFDEENALLPTWTNFIPVLDLVNAGYAIKKACFAKE